MKTGRWVPVIIAAGIVWASGLRAGDLSPPGPPGATMKTLQEIYDRIMENQQRLENLEFRMIEQAVPQGMVVVPGGTNSGTDPDHGAYNLSVDTFYMDASPVTKAQWDEVYNWAVARGYSFDNAGSGKGPDYPVHKVSWYDSVKWCNARSQKEGRTPVYTVSNEVYQTSSFGATGSQVVECNFNADGYRLPTVTEHKYASRGGLSGKRFPWGDTITHTHANYFSDESHSYDTSPTRGYHAAYYDPGNEPYTSPAGSFAPNGYGLYDMSGNLWEWCWDASGSVRLLRGGCYASQADHVRCGDVMLGNPEGAGNASGFRTVCR